MMMLKYYKILK